MTEGLAKTLNSEGKCMRYFALFFSKVYPSKLGGVRCWRWILRVYKQHQGKKKITLDLNPDVRKFAGRDVKVILSNSTNMKQIKDNTVDIAFVSNFFEHLTRQEIVGTIKEVHRVLKGNGKQTFIYAQKEESNLCSSCLL
ncbi:MAG TPA: methyltransferase domain-containing protein [Candidatus Omnitrophica bacterium]|nr:methyltransferase domain-containing protein [Candidatus Omnitrophota bacterium]